MEEDGDGGGRQAPPSCRAGVARMRAAGYARAETSAVLKTPGDPASGRSRQSDRPRSSRPARWRRSSRRHAARCWSSRNHHEQSSQLQRTRWADVATDTGRLTPRGYRPPARRRARRLIHLTGTSSPAAAAGFASARVQPSWNIQSSGKGSRRHPRRAASSRTPRRPRLQERTRRAIALEAFVSLISACCPP